MLAAGVMLILITGGYNDWFLLSKDELNEMYEELKLENAGDFSNDEYWSSSEREIFWIPLILNML